MHLGHKVIVTDPCYSLDTWCNYIVSNVLPGEYKTSVKLTDGGFWGERVAELIAINTNYQTQPLRWELVSTDIGVDSGQCGIYDFSYRLSFGNSCQGSFFYKKACKCTDKEERYGEQEDSGVTSCSGYGDGCYYLYIAKNQQKEVVAMKIVFIKEDNLDQEDDLFEEE